MARREGLKSVYRVVATWQEHGNMLRQLEVLIGELWQKVIVEIWFRKTSATFV
jgi:hypothetical protein